MSDTSREKIYGLDASERNTRVLRIKVLRALDLQRRDFLGGSGDPYVKILLQSRENRNQTIDIATTRIVPKTLNPLWNQDFLFRVCKIKEIFNFYVLLNRLIQVNIDLCLKFMIKINLYVYRIYFRIRTCLCFLKTKDEFLGMFFIELS